MEIRNALQKIENYLTVVSNLNKTILSEGTMSRDELLLMKKYLYTSIDRIEDIEKMLMIGRQDEKSFTPTETVVNNYVPPKAKEIVEVIENTHIEEVESKLSVEDKKEVEEAVVEIHAEIVREDLVNEVTQSVYFKEVQEGLETIAEEHIVPQIPVSELEHLKEEETETDVVSTFEITPMIQNIITEDFAVDELKETVAPEEKKSGNIKIPLVAETMEEENVVIPFINKLEIPAETFASKFSENKVATFADQFVNKDKAEVKNEIKKEDKKIDAVVAKTVLPVLEDLSSKFSENKGTTFAEQLASKKEEKSLFEELNQKLNPTPQQQLFEMFDDHKEDLHETFLSQNSYEPLKTNFDDDARSYAHTAVLVEDKVVEPVIEQLTPSSLNEVFKPQQVDTSMPKVHKTFSESIALNDKFIFVRELFGNQFAEYEHGLKQLDQQSTFTMADAYCKENLWNKFNWKNKGTAVQRFMELLQKRFN